MTKSLITLVAGFIFSAYAMAAADLNPSSTATNTPPINVPYSDVLKQVVRQSDLTLSYGPDQFQFGQLWFTSNQDKSSANPLVVFIHGGCWLNAFDIKHSYALTTAIAQQGFNVWSLEYRRTGDEGGGWPGSMEDVLAGIRYIQQYQDDRIDRNNVILSGHSAGGHLALMSGSLLQKETIKGVVGLAAIADIKTYSEGENSCQQATSGFMGGSSNEIPDLYKKANPIAQSLHPLSILLHGDKDAIVPISQASAAGLPVEVVKGAGHFDWIHPQTQAFTLFIEQLNKMTNK